MNAPVRQVELPQYRAHKVVGAAKIVAIWDGDKVDLDPHGIVEVGHDWLQEKRAQVGGYFVAYEDGCTSFSPAKAFEEGYRAINAPAPGTLVYGNPDPHSPAAALAEARHLLARPEMMSTEANLRRVIDGLVRGIDRSKCFATAMAKGLDSFTLLETDKAAPDAMREWAEQAAKNGCRPAKVSDAFSMASRFEANPNAKWPD